MTKSIEEMRESFHNIRCKLLGIDDYSFDINPPNTGTAEVNGRDIPKPIFRWSYKGIEYSIVIPVFTKRVVRGSWPFKREVEIEDWEAMEEYAIDFMTNDLRRRKQNDS